MVQQSLQALNHQQKEEIWALRIKECRESGIGVQAWCREQGLSYHTYYMWQQRLYRKLTEPENGFYEIMLELGEFDPREGADEFLDFLFWNN